MIVEMNTNRFAFNRIAPPEAALMGDECGCEDCQRETLRDQQPIGLQRLQFVEFNEVWP